MRFAILDHLFSASLVRWGWQTLLFQFMQAQSPLSVQLKTPVCLSVPRLREGLATAAMETSKQWPLLLGRREERKEKAEQECSAWKRRSVLRGHLSWGDEHKTHRLPTFLFNMSPFNRNSHNLEFCVRTKYFPTQILQRVHVGHANPPH